jgi:hypothetical protein
MVWPHTGCKWKAWTDFGHEIKKKKNEEKHNKKEKKKTVHVSMCSETFNLWVTDERILSWPIQHTHIGRIVQHVLGNTYHDLWRDRWPTAWSPRSSHFNLPDLYLWGTVETLHHPIVNAWQTNSKHPRCVDVCTNLMGDIWALTTHVQFQL